MLAHSHEACSVGAGTKLFGIFGNPIHHSLSPKIHNTMLKHLGLDAVYLAFQVEPALLSMAFESVRALKIKGLNVTVPYKEEAMALVDEVPEDLDRRIGAINTVLNRDGKLLGYNTDGPGFLQALSEELKLNPAGKKILVLGAGGSARSVIFSLAKSGADEVLILNRSHERAVGLAEHLDPFFPEVNIDAVASLEDLGPAPKIDLVINATSLGLNPQDSPAISLERLGGRPAVYDLIYQPRETALLSQAKKMGLLHANGLGMLVNQAALSFQIWNGRHEGLREKMKEVVQSCLE